MHLNHEHTTRTLTITQAGANAALNLAKQAAGAVGSGVQGALAPFDVFNGDGLGNFLFWAVLALFLYNVVVLAPRQ